MIKTIKIIIFILLSFSIKSFSQTDNLDYLMTKRRLECWDIKYNCHYLIPEYYTKNKIDTVELLLDYWEKNCNLTEEIFRTKLLLSIYNGNFDTESINNDLFYFLIIYKFRYIPDYYEISTNFYDDFTHKFANDLKKDNLDLNSKFILDYYSDSLSSKIGIFLQNPEYNGTKIQQEYFNFKDSLLRIPVFYWGVYSGVYSPIGNNKILGNKGNLGFFSGCKLYKNYFEANLDFKFGKSKQFYTVIYNDTLTSTNEYLGFYIGLNYYRALLQTKKIELLLNFGLGGERITAISVNENIDKLPKFLWTPNINCGIGLKYSIKDNIFLGLFPSYNFLNYQNTGGTSLKGNAFTINLKLEVRDKYSAYYNIKLIE